MRLKWIPVLAVLCLLLPHLTLGAETTDMTEPASPVFKPTLESPEDLFREQKGTAEEVFGGRHGYVHPFLSVGGYATSNLFNAPDNEESDSVLLVSPGIWLALPASRQKLLEIETLNTEVGGLEVSRFHTKVERRFQSYALYRGTFSSHYRFSSADTDDHRAEALLAYNAPGGLSIELLEIFEKDHDPFSTGDSPATQLDKYHSNLLTPSVSYEVGPKLMLRVDYDWYVLNYSAPRNDSKDREDQVISTYVFYHFTPKTSTFLDYEYAMVDYDKPSRSDSDENRYYAGLQWLVTEKSRGRIKLGYGKRKFDKSDEERTFFASEVRIDHRLTRKTSVFLQASRKAGQSDVQGTRDVLKERVKFGYAQDFTAKLSGKISAFYYRNAYDGDITVGDQTDQRTDNKYGGEIALGFSPSRWFNVSTGYLYTERNSNFDVYDYTTHTVFLNLTAAL